MDFDPAFITPESVEEEPRHQLILDITETSMQLASQLRIHREPDIERVILRIDTDELALPDFIRRNVSADTSVPSIVIDATVNRLTQSAEVDLRIESETMDMIMVISNAKDGETPNSSMITTADSEEFPLLMPPSSVEINRFLASLFVKNKTGDYSAFDAMDLRNYQSTHRLLEALKDIADEVITEEEYYTGSTLGATADSIRFTEYDGTLHSATVNIEHHAKASAAVISFTKQPMPWETDDEIDNPEYMMQGLEGVRTYMQDVDGEATNVSSSNDFLRVVRDFLRERRDSVFVQPEIVNLDDTETEDGNYADPSLNINIEDLRSSD